MVLKNVLCLFFPLQRGCLWGSPSNQNQVCGPRCYTIEAFNSECMSTQCFQGQDTQRIKNPMLIHQVCPPALSPEKANQLDRFDRYPPNWRVWRVSIKHTYSLEEEIESRFVQGSFCITLVSLLWLLVGVFPISRLVVEAYYWWADWWSPFVIFFL